MTRDREIERILDRWFEEGPTEVADRVIGDALDIIDRTGQRHASRVLRRYSSMTPSVRLAAAAVVVAVVGGLAFIVLQPKSAPAINVASSPAPASLAPVIPTSAPTAAAVLSSPASVVATGNAVAVAAGGGFTCAITTSAGVKCWGFNGGGVIADYGGYLGDGTAKDSITPVDVSGLTSGVTAISVGGYHSCALTRVGGVQCWGWGSLGQLGNGKTTTSAAPVDVSGLTTGVTWIATGTGFSCAMTNKGGVKCWGVNHSGQLGDGTTTNQSTPVDVASLASGVTAMDGGTEHACALTSAGGVKCWGDNQYGQLGNGSTTGSSTPVDVAGLTSGVTAIASGDLYTCALLGTGGVKCWGFNAQGELGDGSTTTSKVPVDVSGASTGVTAIAASQSGDNKAQHTCALMTAGGVKCWGLNNSGQLGNGSTTNSKVPVDVSGLTSGVTAITAGVDHSCALLAGGGVACWGSNTNGRLGDGTTKDSSTPVVVQGL